MILGHMLIHMLILNNPDFLLSIIDMYYLSTINLKKNITFKQFVADVPHKKHPIQGEHVLDAESLKVPPGHVVSHVLVELFRKYPEEHE